jgi:hypothetical protein
MASADKKTKADPTPKKEAAPADKSAPAATPANDAAPAKAEGGEKAAAAPATYSRGEGQKTVTQAYRDNWNAIFGTDEKKKKKR